VLRRDRLGDHIHKTLSREGLVFVTLPLQTTSVAPDSCAHWVVSASVGSEAEARQAGDDGVSGLDEITAQMAGDEHRPEQQEMCRAVAEAS